MQQTVSALVKDIIVKDLGGEACVKLPSLEPAAALLLKKIQAMPVWLRFPIGVLTFLYKYLGGTVDGWKNSPLKICREFIKFYEKLALFIYYSL